MANTKFLKETDQCDHLDLGSGFVRDSEQTYFVKEVEDRARCPGIIKIAVNKQSSFKELEFGKSKVRRSGCIAALFAKDSHANVGLLHH